MSKILNIEHNIKSKHKHTHKNERWLVPGAQKTSCKSHRTKKKRKEMLSVQNETHTQRMKYKIKERMELNFCNANVVAWNQKEKKCYQYIIEG